jgi:ankyrin repeat protein
MRLRVILLISLVSSVCIHAMQKEAVLNNKTQKQIDKLVSKDDLSAIQKLLGSTPSDTHRYVLEQALIKQKHDIIKWLLDLGIDANTNYASNNTPLHIAAENDDMISVGKLLEHGANINAWNVNQKTPLDIAIAYRSKNVITLLENAKADEEAKKTVPLTPRPRSTIMPKGIKK